MNDRSSTCEDDANKTKSEFVRSEKIMTIDAFIKAIS